MVENFDDFDERLVIYKSWLFYHNVLLWNLRSKFCFVKVSCRPHLSKFYPVKLLHYTVHKVNLHHYTCAVDTYRVAGFVCEVLICANYVRCHGLTHFNSTVTFNSAIVLGVSQLCALLYLMWSKSRYLVSRLPITAGQRNWCFAEIGPHRKNPLYIQYSPAAACAPGIAL